jgi:hypothetical protein
MGSLRTIRTESKITLTYRGHDTCLIESGILEGEGPRFTQFEWLDWVLAHWIYHKRIIKISDGNVLKNPKLINRVNLERCQLLILDARGKSSNILKPYETS